MGVSSVDEEGGDVDGEAFRGHFPLQRKTIFLTNHFRHVKANFRQGLLRGDKI
jgi:hypothetical protein